MPPTHSCECLYHGCFHHIDPKTGKRGRDLPVRVYNTHQANEAKSSLEQRARGLQEAALKSQEDGIKKALTSLNIPPQPPDVVQRAAKYRSDRKKILIAQISDWQEQIVGLVRDLEAITIPSSLTSSSECDQGLIHCCRLRKTCARISAHLSNAFRGSLRKEPSIRVLLHDTRALLDPVESRIADTEKKWLALNDKRMAQEKIAIANGYAFDSRHHFMGILSDTPGVIQMVSLMVVVCHVLLGFSRRGCQWLFAMCVYIIEAAFLHNTITRRLLPYLENIRNLFPKDIRAVTEGFRLEGKHDIYAVCPKCHACYKSQSESDVPIYPPRCNSSRYQSRCGEELLRPKRIGKHHVFVPIKPYVVFDFSDWLARLVSRKGYEKRMDDAWRRMDSPRDAPMEDIFQGSVIRDFMGPDGKTHFSRSGPDANTARYLFSMGCDFFNPLRNLANGKKVSLGIIALICLNLPITVRYRPENIFLASIIPGPKEPNVDNINPYLGPVVDVFLRFWLGVWFTRTCLFEHGRWIICAIVAVVCDIPAARKVGGFSASSHEHFCSVCWCNLTEHGYNNLDYKSWTRRSNHSCREWADKFRQAGTPADAASSFDRSGMRCSELLSLPYFDPARHLVIDPMHNLFLGLIKEHFQSILGYLPEGSKNNGKPDIIGPFTHVNIESTQSNPLPQNTNIKKSIRKLARILQAPFESDPLNDTGRKLTLRRFTSSIHLGALVYVANALNCVVSPDGDQSSRRGTRKLQKKDVASLLIDWKLEQDSVISPIQRTRGFVFKETEIQQLWNDIRNIVKPSWETSVPDNISSAGAKLKSDQWRSIGSLYLPITLIRLWSGPVAIDDAASQERRDLLHLTMLLCSAVSVITARTASASQASLYIHYMSEYRKELRRLFPHYTCHANHHMAMHLEEYLLMYGPVHGWWTFAVERVIGRLQRIKTNYKLGEYEKTISQTWTRTSNFNTLFKSEACPEAIRRCAKLFDKVIKFENRNTLAYTLVDDDDEDLEEIFQISDAEGKSVPAEILRTLRAHRPDLVFPSMATRKGRVTLHGVTYSRHDVHEGNSGILLSGSDVPFCIVDIYQFPDTCLGTANLWFIAKRHRRAHVNHDPYAIYPHIRAKLWDSLIEDKLEAFSLSQIETHFAKCAIFWEGKNLAVIVSLSKSYVEL